MDQRGGTKGFESKAENRNDGCLNVIMYPDFKVKLSFVLGQLPTKQ